MADVRSPALRLRTRYPSVCLAIAVLGGCHLTEAQGPAPKIVLEQEVPPPKPTLIQELDAAVADDAETNPAVAALLENPAQCAEAVEHLAARLEAPDGLDAAGVARALTLYLSCPGGGATAIFEALTAAASPAIQRSGWRLAAARPSRALAVKIGERLSAGLNAPNLVALMNDDVAHALIANKVEGSYTFLRQALAVSGLPSFAEAAIRQQPERVSEDAIAYLAKASLEELRAGPLKSVNGATCTILLAHFKAVPPALSHPNFGHLFLYATAAQPELAGPALEFLASLVRGHAQELAMVLTKMAPGVQVDFVRRARVLAAAEAPRLEQELRLVATNVKVIAVLDGADATP